MPEVDRNHRRSEPHHAHRDRERSHERRDQDRVRDHRTERDHRRKGQDSAYSHQQPHGYDDSFRDEPFTDYPTSNYTDHRPHHRKALYNLRYLATFRGICQALAFFLNMLIVICAGVNHSNKGRYRDIASLGSLYYYYYGGANAFTGAEAERVQKLDDQFYQLKLPPYVFSMACGGALMVYACVLLALGVTRVTYRWPGVLLAEAVSDGLIGLGYVPAVAFYFIKLQETYNHPVCRERDKLYKSKGHNGYGCSLNGADVAGGLFGVLGVIVFPIAAVLAIRAYRTVREQKLQKETEDNNL